MRLPLSADGVQRVVVQGRYGHLSPLLEPALWLPRVRAFLDQEAPVP
ncbi:MAG: hypothetical protein AB7E12_04130 [Burkholderiaceae bacterium]